MYAFIGIVLIMFTVVTGFFLERQQFNRRNSMGVQEFKSYGHMAKTRAAEGALKGVAVVAALVGLGFLIAYFS